MRITQEIKRFINNYIVAYEIYSPDKKIDPTQLLLLQAINVRWNSFYQLIVNSSNEFREEIKKYVIMESSKRTTQLESDKIEHDFNPEFKASLRDFKSDSHLWDFLMDHYETLLEVENWEIYRRATESVKEIPIPMSKDILDGLKRTCRHLSENIRRMILELDALEPSIRKDALISRYYEGLERAESSYSHLFESGVTIRIPDVLDMSNNTQTLQNLTSEFMDFMSNKEKRKLSKDQVIRLSRAVISVSNALLELKVVIKALISVGLESIYA